MVLELESAQIKLLKSAQIVIKGLLKNSDASILDASWCKVCMGSCTDECMGCHTCLNTSIAGG